MPSLIRFEDTYGMTDIFLGISGRPYSIVDPGKHELKALDSDLYINYGLGSRWFILTSADITILRKLGITDIYFIFDLDSPAGHNDEILSIPQLEVQLLQIRQSFEKADFSANLYFMPVVYAAETIALLQYVRECTGSLTNLVHGSNTKKLHLQLLSAFARCVRDSDAKKFHDFLDAESLVEGVAFNLQDNDLNVKLRRWISASCELDPEYFYNEDDLILHHKQICANYTERLKDALKLQIGDQMLDLSVSSVDRIDRHRIYSLPRFLMYEEPCVYVLTASKDEVKDNTLESEQGPEQSVQSGEQGKQSVEQSVQSGGQDEQSAQHNTTQFFKSSE